MSSRLLRLGLVAGSIVSVLGCGGGGGGGGNGAFMLGPIQPIEPQNPAPQAFDISGTISGLRSSITLRQGDGDLIVLHKNGAFKFNKSVAKGVPYDVSVETQPAWQHCAVKNGSGNASSNVSAIEVSCSPPKVTVSHVAGSEDGYGGSTDGSAASARFVMPSGVALDPAGNLLVADEGNSALRTVSKTGDVSTQTFSGDPIASPRGIAVSTHGEILVASPTSSTFLRIFDGVAVSDGSFTAPTGIAVLGDRVYITDIANSAIHKYEYGKGFSKLKLSRQIYPAGIAVDAAGAIYVTDLATHAILKITNESDVGLLAGAGASGAADGTGASASFNAPRGVAVGADNTVYVADSGNHAIRMITPAGAVTTLAGSLEVSGRTGGDRAMARFDTPYGLVLRGVNEIFVADTRNNSIRKIARPAS